MHITDRPDWLADPLFARGANGVGEDASPAFRLSIYLPYQRGYHGFHCEAYEALFEAFKPVIRANCDKALVCTSPGGNFRRGLKIKPENWTPFINLLAAYNNVEDGIFVSFQFADRHDTNTNLGRGPTKFHFSASTTIRLDICISVPDWLAGQIDIARVIAAIQNLPYLSFCGGYGLCLSENALNGQFPASHAVIQKYPALDVHHPGAVAFWRENPIEEVGLCGINWLTGIGEPFRSRMGGASALRAVLPSGVAIDDGPNGVVLQLGAVPITGQTGVDDAELFLYHAVGQSLRDVWMPTEDNNAGPIFETMFNDNALSLAYYQRFFNGSGR